MDFQRLVGARLGYLPFDESSGAAAIVRIDVDSGDLLGSLSLHLDFGRGSSGNRTLRAGLADCEALAASLSMALAMAIDPLAFNQGIEPKTTPVVMPLPASEPLPANANKGSAASLSVSAGPRLVVGALPSPSPGIALQAGLQRENLSVYIEGQLVSAGKFAVASGAVESSSMAAGVGACRHVGVFGVCIRALAGMIEASGIDLKDSRRGSLPTVRAGPLVVAAFPAWRQLLIVTSAGIDVSVLRGSIYVGETEVWRVPRLTAEAGVSAGWRFE